VLRNEQEGIYRAGSTIVKKKSSLAVCFSQVIQFYKMMFSADAFCSLLPHGGPTRRAED
jgi:hypothetical protein